MPAAPVLLRADSAYYRHAPINAALNVGADVSATARQDPAVKRAIGTIPDSEHQVHERHLRPRHRHLGFRRGDRRGALHRVHLPGQEGSRSRSPRRQAHPGTQLNQTLPADPLQHARVPCLLHHQRSRHGHRGSGEPSACDHRASPRGLEGFGPRAPVLGPVHRKRGLACSRGHRVQPHPHCRHHHRAGAPVGEDRDDPSETDHYPRAGRAFRTTLYVAPAPRLAL